MTTGISPTDFANRLDRTAEETETLLGALLSDGLLPDEIARPQVAAASRIALPAASVGTRQPPTLASVPTVHSRCQTTY